MALLMKSSSDLVADHGLFVIWLNPNGGGIAWFKFSRLKGGGFDRSIVDT